MVRRCGFGLVGRVLLALFGVWHFARADSRPCVLRPPSWRPSHFLLLVQEKVTKENTPTRPRSPGVSPAPTRGRCGGSLTARPCADSERARIVRAPLWAFSYAASPRPRGTR